MSQINLVVHNPKGGVGKTVISALATEWFLHQESTVNLVDADGNYSSSEWVQNNREEGREILTPQNPDVLIVDTKGVPGSAAPFFQSATLILTPFQPYGYDVSEAIEMFDALPPELRTKVAFIPNRLSALGSAKEQLAGIDQIRRVITEEGAGHLLPGLIDRIAVYPDLFNGSAENFYERKGGRSLTNAQHEASYLFQRMMEIILTVRAVA